MIIFKHRIYKTTIKFAGFEAYSESRNRNKSSRQASDEMRSKLLEIRTIEIIKAMLNCEEQATSPFDPNFSNSVTSPFSKFKINNSPIAMKPVSEIVQVNKTQSIEISALHRKLEAEITELKRFKTDHTCIEKCMTTFDSLVKENKKVKDKNTAIKFENSKLQEKRLEENELYTKTEAETKNTHRQELETVGRKFEIKIARQTDAVKQSEARFQSQTIELTESKSQITKLELEIQNFLSETESDDKLKLKVKSLEREIKLLNSPKTPISSTQNTRQNSKQKIIQDLELQLQNAKADKKSGIRDQKQKYQIILCKRDQKIHELQTKVTDLETEKLDIEKAGLEHLQNANEVKKLRDKVKILETEKIDIRKEGIKAVENVRNEEKERYQEQAEFNVGADSLDCCSSDGELKMSAETLYLMNIKEEKIG